MVKDTLAENANAAILNTPPHVPPQPLPPLVQHNLPEPALAVSGAYYRQLKLSMAFKHFTRMKTRSPGHPVRECCGGGMDGSFVLMA